MVQARRRAFRRRYRRRRVSDDLAPLTEHPLMSIDMLRRAELLRERSRRRRQNSKNIRRRVSVRTRVVTPKPILTDADFGELIPIRSPWRGYYRWHPPYRILPIRMPPQAL